MIPDIELVMHASSENHGESKLSYTTSHHHLEGNSSYGFTAPRGDRNSVIQTSLETRLPLHSQSPSSSIFRAHLAQRQPPLTASPAGQNPRSSSDSFDVIDHTPPTDWIQFSNHYEEAGKDSQKLKPSTDQDAKLNRILQLPFHDRISAVSNGDLVYKPKEGSGALVVNFATLQRMRLQILQSQLIKDALAILYQDDLRTYNYELSLQQYST